MVDHSNIEFEKEFSERLTVHRNLDQEVVVTTVDKVRICLMANRDHMATKREWVTPLSLFITLTTTLVAAEFKNFLLDKALWQAIYLVCAVISAIWCVSSASRSWRHRNRGSIEAIVDELKSSAIAK
jgi:hypothetical protein